MNTPYPRLEEGLHVCGQIALGELPAIAAAGFRSLLCNRPDGEAAGQPDMQQVAGAAAALGLAFRAVPVVGSAIGEVDIAAERSALAELPRPILAYCRSGNRCSVMWALARAGELPVPLLLERAGSAGYDLAALRPWLLARSRAD